MLRNGGDSGSNMGAVYLGMIVAVISTNSSDITNLPSWQRLQTLIPVEFAVTIQTFVLFQATREKEASSYDSWHAFISIFPIRSFQRIGKPDSSTTKSTHSTTFAFIGRYSLEMFMRTKFYGCADCWDSQR